MLKLKEALRAAKEVKEEMEERDADMSSLSSKLLSLQMDIKSLHNICKRQGRTLQDSQLCTEEEEAMLPGSQNKKQELACEESEMEFGSNKHGYLKQLQQLKSKLLALQQELECRTEELQTSYSSLLQYQSILEKQTCDLVQLHHHCKMKEDEVILYEEELENQNESTGKKLHIAQEQLALAGDKIISLERSLNLYKDKYQTSLSNIELLECQVKILEGELNGIVCQDPENKGDHSKMCMYAASCMSQDHRETLKRLSEVWQKVSEQDDLIQELRNKLACSNALVLEREESLIKLQADFASYKAIHRHPPLSSGDCEDMKKILKQLQEQKDSQCQHVEEFQNLVKGLQMELEVVSEQKKNIMKDMMRLELELHTIREETSCQIERKDKETIHLQWVLQEMEWRFCEIQKYASEKDKGLQEKNEMLTKLQNELSQACEALKNKEMELEKQQQMAAEQNKDANQETNEALNAELQTLKKCLEEAKRHQKLSAQQACQSKEQVCQTEKKLEDAQRKIQSYCALDKEKEETIQDLQKDIETKQQECSKAREQLSNSREQMDDLTLELTEAKRMCELSKKEKQQLQKTICELELKLKETLEQMKQLQHQNKEQACIKDSLEDELHEVKITLEEKQQLLKKHKEEGKMVEKELESCRQEERKKEKTSKENMRKLEAEKENLQAELLQCSAQLEASANKYNIAQETIEELNKEICQQKDSIKNLHTQLAKAVQREKECMQTMVCKEAYDELSRKATNCQEDLTRALEKLNQAASESKDLHRSLTQAQERKNQLEDEITAYEERMRKLNLELKKLQGFHQQSEQEVHAFDKKLEEMTNQVLQWQKQHKNDLKMLAAKEEQLMGFQEEMAALKKKLLEEEKPCCAPSEALPSRPKDNCRLHHDSDQIMVNMEQWAKEQKIANEKLGSKLREQVKYIAKLTGEKDHLHNVMMHLQQENKKLKSEIEEKKLNVGHQKLHCKPAGSLSRTEPSQKERKMCGAMGLRGIHQDSGQRDNKMVGMPHHSGSSFC
ncbi:PREDICTED: polyamine-modulated factor 1-binding protein 1 [Elephantulus edwardii]|uniref:polyamine-modulated factor 1-binding protein 1 n=1 Tax=Elephantulus edwardii TaxID=28737 RepID=UPI0003F0C97A|nr:PREDICTED: polyamine-modulated factor 1-binding protein 1 [Elephantulus edwardii]